MRGLFFLAVILTTGCSFAPPTPHSRLDPAPELFASLDRKNADELLAQGWWKQFNDPVLDELVERSVERNLDVAIAATRVAQARELLTVAGGELLPSGDISGSASRAKSSSPFGTTISNSYIVSFGISYELDFWGRVANQRRYAIENLLATEGERLAVYQGVVAETVRGYFDAIFFTELEKLAERTLKTDEKRLELIKARYSSGLTVAQDVYLARQNLTESEARLELLKQERVLSIHRLNILTASYPTTDQSLLGAKTPELPPPPPVGIPSSLLTNRPDVATAWHRVEAAAALAGVAVAERFPRFALTGSFGQSSDKLGDLFVSSNNFWTLLGNVAQPIFNSGALKAREQEARRKLEEAAILYDKAALRAFREVEDALVTETRQRAALEALVSSTEQARLALNASEGRYFRGLSDLTPALNARTAYLRAEQAMIETHRRLILNRVGLHLALGGHWGHEEGLDDRSRPAEKEAR